MTLETKHRARNDDMCYNFNSKGFCLNRSTLSRYNLSTTLILEGREKTNRRFFHDIFYFYKDTERWIRTSQCFQNKDNHLLCKCRCSRTFSLYQQSNFLVSYMNIGTHKRFNPSDSYFEKNPYECKPTPQRFTPI